MRKRTVLMGLAFGVLLSTLCISGVLAQQRGGAGGGGFDPAQMRQRIAERMMERLGCTAEEWAVIGPRYEKVTTLSREISGGGMRGMFGGGRGGRGGEAPGAGGAPAGEPSAVQKATQELQAAVENEASTPEQIKLKIKALREAREKAKQELAKAEVQLREVLSLRQEAILILQGTLQ
jgi:hypothetical protein